MGSALRLLVVALALLLTSFEATNAKQWPERLVGHGGPIKAISISADGKYALTASFDYSIILWDLAKPEGAIIHRFMGHNAAVNDVVFSKDAKQAVSVGDDGALCTWDLVSGKLIKCIQGDAYKVLDVALSSDGRYAADARWDATARLYDLKLGAEIASLRGHRGNVNSVTFSADGTKLYTAAYDGQIIEWDAENGTMIRPIYKHGWGINSIAFVDKDRLLFGALNGAVGVVSIARAELEKELVKRERPIQSVKRSHDGALIGYGDGSGQIGVYIAETLEPVETGQVAYGPVWDFDFLPGSTQTFHVGLDDYAIRWQIAPRKLTAIKSKFPRRFQFVEAGDPGELEFRRKCSVCHTLTPDGANRAGPTLYRIFGRKAGTLPGYNYSKALLDSDVIWDEHTIAQLFDDGPDVMMPGTKMPIQRLKSVSRRDELIRYLRKVAGEEEK